jgi:hypothetical protein
VEVGEAVLESSDEVRVCTKGLSSDGLVDALGAHLGRRLTRARDCEELDSGTVSFSGTVADLLEHLGLEDYREGSAQ